MKAARILLPIDASGASQACTETAVALAIRMDCSLEVLHPCLPAIDRLTYVTASGDPLHLQEMLAAEKKVVGREQERARAWFESTSSFKRCNAEFRTEEGYIAQRVAARGRVADFTVVPTRNPDDSYFWINARDGALFDSGRAVLLVPSKTGIEDIGDTIVVGWKNRLESSRAILGARSLLEKAKRVRLVEVTENDEPSTVHDAKDYLVRAGLNVKISQLTNGGSVGEFLIDVAMKEKGSILVMGAYGHWRWREVVFGGATEFALNNTLVPVLMMR